jgi:hypothetical protein
MENGRWLGHGASKVVEDRAGNIQRVVQGCSPGNGCGESWMGGECRIFGRELMQKRLELRDQVPGGQELVPEGRHFAGVARETTQ